MSEILDTARALARAGYYTAPVSVRLDERGKKKPDFPGPWSAMSTLEPGYNFDAGTPGLIIDCEKSGIIVIDVDEHGEVSGSAALRAAGIALPPTPMTVTTWSGGQHRFYLQPAEPLSCAQNTPVRGVDIRGLGGIVFGPGTEVRDAAGNLAGSYRLDGLLIEASALPVLSAEFQAAVAASQRRPERPERAAPRERTVLSAQAGRGVYSDHQRAVLAAWMAEDLEAIAAAGDGERHGVLLARAAKVLDRGRKLGQTGDTLVSLIHDAYEQSGGREWGEKRLIVDWAFDRLEDEPLADPDDVIDPDDVRFEEAVRAEVTKGRIRNEAKRRLSQDQDPVDLGRELDFDEPPGGLHGRFWVDSVLPAGETVLLFGERNVGKSFVAIDLGLSVASGQPWHGRATTAGNVLYLAGEGAIGLPSRRRAWVQHHGVESPERFRLRDAIVHLTNPGSMAAWQKVIVEDGIDLVILDTVRRAARGLEMESPGDAQEIIELLDELRSVRHGCTVLALGHPTKSDPTQPAGAGTVQDALPMIHRLSKDGEGAATLVDLVTTKSKDGPTGHLVSWTHHRVRDSLVFVEHGKAAPEDRRRNEEEGWLGR